MATEWILQELPLEKILNHEVNLSIYGTKIDDDLVKSIEKIGVTHPIHVVKHKGGSFVCLSGHRRKQHAQIAGLTKINCLVARQEMTEAEQVVFLCESNRQRIKTTEQLARETEALSEAYGTVAKERQKRGKKPESDLMKNVSQGRAEDNLAITQAAKETGIGSRPTAEKAIEVVHAIDAATDAGDTETAEELRETLNNKSVKAAHEKATGKPAKEKPAKASATNGKTTVAGYDAREFVKPLGAFTRVVDDAATACGLNNGPAHKKLLAALGECYELAGQFAKECHAIAQRKAKGK